MKKISIITPSLNQGEFIRDAIESVLVQNDPCFEHIVVDGGSTDSTLDILKEYPHLKWISEPDRGQCEAVDKGLAMCTGDIVGEINADDYYLPGAFKKVRERMEAPEAKEVCLGACDFIRDGRITMTWRLDKVDLRTALRFPCNPIPQPSLFMSTSIFRKIGGLDPDIIYGPDIVQFVKLAEITDFDIILDSIAVNRSHGGAIQERDWDRNFTAVLYHLARLGDFENFHEMYSYTYERFRNAKDVDLVIHLVLELVRSKWQLLANPGTSEKPKYAIFGAGCHTSWLEEAVKNIDGPDIVAITDEQAGISKKFWNLPVIQPHEVNIGEIDAIIISTDAYYDKMAKRCRELFGDSVRLINLYENLPRGPYRK